MRRWFTTVDATAAHWLIRLRQTINPVLAYGR